MARLTKISPYRTGAPRFGTKGHAQIWDNSVKVSYLSPEELEEYRSGRKGGSRMFTYDDYLKFQKDGLSNAEIAKKMNISQATLYNRLKVWKQQPLKSELKNAQEPQGQKEKVTESENEQNNKSGELVALIATLKAELEDKNNKIASLQGINVDRETAYESFKSDYLHLKNQKEEEIEKLKKEVTNARQQHVDLQERLQETAENLEEVLGTNENLHKEIVVMNNSLVRSTELLNSASDEIEKVTKKYNDLKREVEPLRQLALMKLQQDVGA